MVHGLCGPCSSCRVRVKIQWSTQNISRNLKNKKYGFTLQCQLSNQIHEWENIVYSLAISSGTGQGFSAVTFFWRSQERQRKADKRSDSFVPLCSGLLFSISLAGNGIWNRRLCGICSRSGFQWTFRIYCCCCFLSFWHFQKPRAQDLLLRKRSIKYYISTVKFK